MLRTLRNKALRKPIFMMIAVAIVIAFAISGISLIGEENRSGSALATLGKKKITVTEYLKHYGAVRRQAGFMYGPDSPEIKRINFKGEAWDRLLLLDYAKKERIRVPDKEVVDWVTRQPAFQDKEKFQKRFYDIYITQHLRTTPRQFEEEIREMLTIAHVAEKTAETPLSDEKLKELYLAEKTEKDLLYAILPWEKEKERVKPTEKDVAAVYEMVKENLTEPERVKISYVFVPKNAAESAKAALEDKESGPQELSAKFGLERKESGLFARNESVPGIDSPEVLEKAFSLAQGQSGDWIDASDGYFKIKVEEKKPERKLSMEEAKDQLTAMITRQDATRFASETLAAYKAEMKDKDFETVLKEKGLEVLSFEKYRKGMYPAGIYPSEGLQQAVSALGEGGISDPFQVPQGAMIVKVAKVHAPDASKFEEEKAEFGKLKSSELAGEQMEALLEKLREKLSLNLELMKDIFPGDS